MKMHAGEVDLDAEVVAALVAGQFPDLARLPIAAVRSTGTVNAIYRETNPAFVALAKRTVEEVLAD